jgi:hypothetical protein
LLADGAAQQDVVGDVADLRFRLGLAPRLGRLFLGDLLCRRDDTERGTDAAAEDEGGFEGGDLSPVDDSVHFRLSNRAPVDVHP